MHTVGTSTYFIYRQPSLYCEASSLPKDGKSPLGELEWIDLRGNIQIAAEDKDIVRVQQIISQGMGLAPEGRGGC